MIFRKRFGTLHEDKAGNRLERDPIGGSVSVKNRKGRTVKRSEFDKFMKRNPKAKKRLRDSVF